MIQKKIFIYSFYITIFFSSVINAQKNYFQPTINYTADIISNFSGGNKKTTQLMGLVDAGIMFNSDSAQWWKGGSLNMELICTHGKGISATTFHDLQGVCSIEAGNHPLLFWELWYHQQLGKFGIRGGLQNINSDFMNQSYTDFFSCGAYSVFPTLTLNYSLANYPIAGLGISFSYQINNKITLLSSVFNGKTSNLSGNKYNTRWEYNIKKEGILSVSEFKYISDSTKRLSSSYSLGIVYHNKPFISIKEKYESDTESKMYNNNYTFYAFSQHDFYKTSNKNAGVFIQASYAPKNRNVAYLYLSTGLISNNLITSSHINKAGIGLSQLYYQDTDDIILKKGIESTFETFYMYQASKYLSVKPTFFTIISSGKTCITAAMVEFDIAIF